MKPLFWIGLVLLILGLGSLIVPIPRHERDGVKIGGVGWKPAMTKQPRPS